MQKHRATCFNAGFAIAIGRTRLQRAVHGCKDLRAFRQPVQKQCPATIRAGHIHYVIWRAFVDRARRVHEHAPDKWMQDLSTGTVEGQKFATQRFARWT